MISFTPTMTDEGYHAGRERVIAEFELSYLRWLVERAGGNLSRAARIAGVDRTTLYRMMDRHALHRNAGTLTLVETNSGAA
jgi:transcriptional regulator of acetoin/glycerol metabolism